MKKLIINIMGYSCWIAIIPSALISGSLLGDGLSIWKHLLISSIPFGFTIPLSLIAIIKYEWRMF